MDDRDGPIERWWELKERAVVLAELKALGITLITTPNYSVLTRSASFARARMLCIGPGQGSECA
ncbi:hypothetical protein ACWIGM_10000 [Bosea sp. NPDC055332]